MASEVWTPVSRHAVQQIQQMILDGRFRPGTRLPSQRELSNMLKLSRASLREALSALESLGLVRMEPGRGTFVNDPKDVASNKIAPWRFADRYPLAEVYQLRYALEGFGAGRAAMAISDAQLSDLRTAWSDMSQSVERMDLATAADCDFRFHQILLEACGNNMLRETWNGVRNVLFASQNLPFARHDKTGEPVAEHKRILDAVARRNEKAATRAMQDHIRRAAARVGVEW